MIFERIIAAVLRWLSKTFHKAYYVLWGVSSQGVILRDLLVFVFSWLYLPFIFLTLYHVYDSFTSWDFYINVTEKRSIVTAYIIE